MQPSLNRAYMRRFKSVGEAVSHIVDANGLDIESIAHWAGVFDGKPGNKYVRSIGLCPRFMEGTTVDSLLGSNGCSWQ